MANIGTEASDFFQSDASLIATKRRQLKQSNTLGDPRILPAKILSLQQLISPLYPGPDIYLLVTDAGFRCRVVNALSGKSVAILKGHSGPVTCAVYHNHIDSGDTFIYTGSWDKSIKKWSLKNKSCLDTWTIHGDFVKSLAITKDGNLLASGSSDKSIRLHYLNRNHDNDNNNKSFTTRTEKLLGHTGGVEAIKFTPDENYLWSVSSDGTLRQWCLTINEQITLGTGHHTSIYVLYLDNEDIWTGSADHQAIRWSNNSTTNTSINPSSSLPNIINIIPEIKLNHPDYVTAILPILDGSIIITGSCDENIRVWDVASEQLIKSVQGHFDTVTSLILIGDTIYSGSLDCTIRSWKLSDIMDPKIQFNIDICLDQNQVTQKSTQTLLTMEEEDELAELMSD